jgi:hypothetical protein
MRTYPKQSVAVEAGARLGAVCPIIGLFSSDGRDRDGVFHGADFRLRDKSRLRGNGSSRCGSSGVVAADVAVADICCRSVDAGPACDSVGGKSTGNDRRLEGADHRWR